jgi:hypothetical protein
MEKVKDLSSRYWYINPSLPSAGQKTNKKEEIVDESTCNLLILLSGGF